MTLPTSNGCSNNQPSRHDHQTSSCSTDDATPIGKVIRSVVSDMHGIFRRVRALRLSMGMSIGVLEASQLSQLYRSVLKNALFRLNNNKEYSDEEKNAYGNLLMSSQIVWSLFETITLRPSSNSPVIDLLEWNRENACALPDTRLINMMNDLTHKDNASKVEQHPDYWIMVLQQVMFGNFDTAVTLLKFHSKYKENDINYSQIVATLESIALALARNQTSTDEFVKIQKNLELLRSTAPANCHDLKYLYSILLGEPFIFVESATKFEMKWYEIFPAFLLFSQPKATVNDLGGLAMRLYKQIESGTESFLLDEIFLAIFNMNFLDAVKMICSTGSESWWLAVHLIDLISLHDPSVFLTPVKNETPELDLRTRILVNYADILFENGLWEISIDYYMYSGMENACDAMDERMQKIAWKNKVSVVERIVSTCSEYGFWRAKSYFTRTVALKYADSERWSAALCWAMRNGNVVLIAQIAERILHSATAEEMSSLHMFDKMSDKFLVTPELHILFKFYNYRKHVNEGDLSSALSTLHDLFLSKNAPERFFVTILREITRLLYVFNSDELAVQDFNHSDANKLDEINEMRSSFNADAIQNLMKALTKFEYYYATHYVRQPTADNIDSFDDIQKELQKLRPQLCSLLSYAFLADVF